MTAEQPCIMQGQHQGEAVTETWQGSQIKIAAVPQPCAVKIVAMNDIGELRRNALKAGCARELKIFLSLPTLECP